MVEYFITVRELVNKTNWDLLAAKFAEMEGRELEKYKGRIISSYKNSIAELFKMKEEAGDITPEALIISYIKGGENSFNDEDYIDVAMKNSKFVEDPEEGLSAWGGSSKDKDDCPEGSYNCNWEGYQRVYGLSGIDLLPLLDGQIFFADQETADKLKDKDIDILAAILYEFTFYGFSHASRQEFVDELKERMDKINSGEGEFYTIEEARQKLLGSDPTVIQYKNPLKKNESER